MNRTTEKHGLRKKDLCVCMTVARPRTGWNGLCLFNSKTTQTEGCNNTLKLSSSRKTISPKNDIFGGSASDQEAAKIGKRKINIS